MSNVSSAQTYGILTNWAAAHPSYTTADLLNLWSQTYNWLPPPPPPPPALATVWALAQYIADKYDGPPI